MEEIRNNYGAKVDAFEIQKPTAEELKRRISNISPYFWEEDNLEEILHVFPENALTTLCNAEFNQQYDFVWIAQVLHFLTPAEIQQLSILLQVILKPGGRVFAEANAIYTFQSIDTNNCLKSAYEKTKSEGITSPYIFTINSLTQAGFDFTSYHYNPVTGQKLIGSPVSEVTYSFCVKLHKPPELICQDELSDSSNNTVNLLPSSSLFNESHHDRLILELETNCKNKAANASLLEAASNRDYALALRKACAVGNLLLIKSILKYKNSLDININLPSATNGFTALDWINASQKVDFLTKERIISLLLRNGAESGIIEDTPQHISQIH